MSHDLIALGIASVTAVGGILGLLVRGIIKYLFDRIATLEKREEGFNAAAAAVVTNLNASMSVVSTGVVELVGDLRYRERQRQEQAAQAQEGRH